MRGYNTAMFCPPVDVPGLHYTPVNTPEAAAAVEANNAAEFAAKTAKKQKMSVHAAPASSVPPPSTVAHRHKALLHNVSDGKPRIIPYDCCRLQCAQCGLSKFDEIFNLARVVAAGKADVKVRAR